MKKVRSFLSFIGKEIHLLFYPYTPIKNGTVVIETELIAGSNMFNRLNFKGTEYPLRLSRRNEEIWARIPVQGKLKWQKLEPMEQIEVKENMKRTTKSFEVFIHRDSLRFSSPFA